jgi:putative ABC transport system ATP-binding protein
MRPATHPAPTVRLEGVNRSYGEGAQRREVLRDVNLEVAAGERLALLGRSGSGKSTLLNLLAAIDRPNAGRILIRGRDLAGAGDRERTLFRRRFVGFVYQFFNLIPTLSAGDNLGLPLELNGVAESEIRTRVAETLEAVGLADRRDDFTDRLSGGEQQRLAVARALIHRPALVLADEPTGNLDADSGARVLDLLTGLSRKHGTTLIMVTHSLAVARSAERTLALLDGHIQPVVEGLAW